MIGLLAFLVGMFVLFVAVLLLIPPFLNWYGRYVDRWDR